MDVRDVEWRSFTDEKKQRGEGGSGQDADEAMQYLGRPVRPAMRGTVRKDDTLQTNGSLA